MNAQRRCWSGQCSGSSVGDRYACCDTYRKLEKTAAADTKVMEKGIDCSYPYSCDCREWHREDGGRKHTSGFHSAPNQRYSQGNFDSSIGKREPRPTLQEGA